MCGNVRKKPETEWVWTKASLTETLQSWPIFSLGDSGWAPFSECTNRYLSAIKVQYVFIRYTLALDARLKGKKTCKIEFHLFPRKNALSGRSASLFLINAMQFLLLLFDKKKPSLLDTFLPSLLDKWGYQVRNDFGNRCSGVWEGVWERKRERERETDRLCRFHTGIDAKRGAKKIYFHSLCRFLYHVEKILFMLTHTRTRVLAVLLHT